MGLPPVPTHSQVLVGSLHLLLLRPSLALHLGDGAPCEAQGGGDGSPSEPA